ncbi:hypothetical protein Cs7R123_49850 [Catellatospora sp. TT07R-123]|uniref:CU044_2847 family protein n=1 Tax=Catellatospora sp. TT07R-123 TaxID=2733863 RepID=UPI001B28E87A|nr:CU044_2847 family protein [Catellatospora sp. TT07R-123]GHJ47643.1 hypothetical protein Cs7R123_49850 [Catellatospora sp. TT07R-123]
MDDVMAVPLAGGGLILVEGAGQAAAVGGGPVKAGRISDAVQAFPTTLQQAMGPIAEAARAVLDELRRAQPDEVEVEFGVDLAVEAGAVITRSEARSHLRVTVRWHNASEGRSPQS